MDQGVWLSGSSLTCDKVAAFEGLCELLRVFVLPIPDWVSLRVKVLPEVGKGYCKGVLVGILPLELVHHKRAKNIKKRKIKSYLLSENEVGRKISCQNEVSDFTQQMPGGSALDSLLFLHTNLARVVAWLPTSGPNSLSCTIKLNILFTQPNASCSAVYIPQDQY